MTLFSDCAHTSAFAHRRHTFATYIMYIYAYICAMYMCVCVCVCVHTHMLCAMYLYVCAHMHHNMFKVNSPHSRFLFVNCMLVCARAFVHAQTHHYIVRCTHARKHIHLHTLQKSASSPLFSSQPSFQNSILTFASSKYAPPPPTKVGTASQSARTTYLSPCTCM